MKFYQLAFKNAYGNNILVPTYCFNILFRSLHSIFNSFLRLYCWHNEGIAPLPSPFSFCGFSHSAHFAFPISESASVTLLIGLCGALDTKAQRCLKQLDEFVYRLPENISTLRRVLLRARSGHLQFERNLQRPILPPIYVLKPLYYAQGKWCTGLFID